MDDRVIAGRPVARDATWRHDLWHPIDAECIGYSQHHLDTVFAGIIRNAAREQCAFDTAAKPALGRTAALTRSENGNAGRAVAALCRNREVLAADESRC